jgi:beta-lactamase class A
MRKQIIIYTFAFFLGLVIGVFITNDSDRSGTEKSADPKSQSAENENVEYRTGGYKFISPLLECDSGQKIYQGQTAALKEKLNNLIAEKIEAKKSSAVAVYFRDLRNGPWFGINENIKFVPASLMKVPVMIAYYKLAESNPQILEKKISTDEPVKESFAQFYNPPEKIQSGKEYSAEELIHRMVAYSDNDALTLLLQNIDQQFLIRSYTDLGVIIPGAKSLDDELTVREYSSFFRILYNASYLEPEYSEQALQALSRSDFKNGIVAGLPENIQVAHKFGERFDVGPENQTTSEKQLHDCGIVYDPNHPYLVCVMSKGDDFDELAKTIRDISRTIYENLAGEK